MLILIVDDEALVRTLLKRILEDNGYGVIEAASGEQAIQILKTAGDTIDLVLTDLKMPGMHGTELAKFVGNQFPTVPVLFMSGYSDELSMLLADGSEFLEKPFKRHILLTKIQSACTRRLKEAKSSSVMSTAAAGGTSQDSIFPPRRFMTAPGPGPRFIEADSTVSRLMQIEWELARKRIAE